MAPRAEYEPAAPAAASCLAPLDAAMDYLRFRGLRAAALYAAGIAPFSLAMLFALDAVTAQRRDALPLASALVALASGWRWTWQAAAQRAAQADLRGEAPAGFWRRLPGILWMRMLANAAILLGGVMVVPAFFGFFLSGLAAPASLESSRPLAPRLGEVLGRICAEARRLAGLWLALLLLAACGLLALLGAQVLIAHVLLPSLFNIDSSGFALTISSPAWTFSCIFFAFVGFDFLWTVTSVMLFYDMQARRLGADLRARIKALGEEER